ncbi:uncharacterized protein LOC101852241 [Aplysia californica]|uniref:Uncharacterized protein LOC101852241 n=1 Tax=Aplysia californica TaxID=6500 RepID=A0ABM1VST6_APLCA|nr:uncharacterized protein LOC101852241 [Aplysia californica]
MADNVSSPVSSVVMATSVFATTMKPSTTTVFRPSEAIISNEALEVIENLFDVGLISMLAIMGIVTNVLDILVFGAQGFRDSVNISLTAIAVWDLIKCVCGITIRVYGPLGWASPAYRQTWKNLTTPTLVYLQVKSIVTPKLTFIMMVVISILTLASLGIIYFIYDIEWQYSTEFNTTIAVYKYNDFYKEHGDIVIEYFNLIGIINPIICFLVIVTCTGIIVYQLQKMSRFRIQSQHKSATGEVQGDMTSRDRQVVKMLLVVIVVYIVALMPRFAHYIGKMMEPEFYYLKKYHNMFNVSAYTVLLFDYINASVNLFIYLSMSSNFRATFYTLFPRCKKQDA